MDWLALLDVEHFLLFTLVLTRVSGLTMTAPIYGTSDVPMQVRVLLAVALALLITPTQWDVAVEYPGTTINYMVFIGSELVVGVCLGMGVTILFSGVQLAGQMISRISGMMLADVFDPSLQASVPTFSRLHAQEGDVRSSRRPCRQVIETGIDRDVCSEPCIEIINEEIVAPPKEGAWRITFQALIVG